MKLKEFHHHRRKQQTCVFMPFVNGTLLTSVEEHQTITTHNPNRHCRVHFYACVGQLLSKQLYTPPKRNRTQVTWVGGEHFRHCTIPAPLNATPNDYIWYLSKHQVLTAQLWLNRFTGYQNSRCFAVPFIFREPAAAWKYHWVFIHALYLNLLHENSTPGSMAIVAKKHFVDLCMQLTQTL